MPQIESVTDYEKRTGLSFGNPYLHDSQNHQFPSITVLAYGLTPTGRLAKRFLYQVMVRKTGRYASMTDTEAAQEAGALYPRERLPKNYKWTPTLIQHNFWNRG